MRYYSLWIEKDGNQNKWFWIVDEETNGKETVLASGIENTQIKAIHEIKKYIPDVEL